MGPWGHSTSPAPMDSVSVARHHTGHNGRDHTNPNTPPTRCPPCQTGRNRWVGTVPQGPFRSGHHATCCPPETALTRCCTAGPLTHGPLDPMEKEPFQTAPGCPFPFSLSRKPLSTPFGIGNSVCMAHMDHWVVLHSVKSTLRAERMTPIRPLHPTPPLGSILQSNRMFGRRKHQRARREIGIRGPGRPRRKLRLQLRPIQRSFRHRDIARGLHESRELAVAHLMGIHQKRRQRHRMGRKLSRQRQAVLPCPHPEGPAGNGHHVVLHMRRQSAQRPWIPP